MKLNTHALYFCRTNSSHSLSKLRQDQFSITPRMNMIKFRLLRKLFEDASTLGFLQVLAAITETATSVKIFATFTFRNNIIYYYDFFDHVFEHYTHRNLDFCIVES